MSKKRPTHVQIDYVRRVGVRQRCGGVSRYRVLTNFRPRGGPYKLWDWRNGFIRAHRGCLDKNLATIQTA